MNDHGPEAKISFFIIFSEMNLFLGIWKALLHKTFWQIWI